MVWRPYVMNPVAYGNRRLVHRLSTYIKSANCPCWYSFKYVNFLGWYSFKYVNVLGWYLFKYVNFLGWYSFKYVKFLCWYSVNKCKYHFIMLCSITIRECFESMLKGLSRARLKYIYLFMYRDYGSIIRRGTRNTTERWRDAEFIHQMSVKLKAEVVREQTWTPFGGVV